MSDTGMNGEVKTATQEARRIAVLRDAIGKEGGPQVFRRFPEASRMIDELPAADVPPAMKERYKLALSSSGLGLLLADMGKHPKISQIDAAVHDVVTNSGLSYGTSLDVVHEFICACGVDETADAVYARIRRTDQGQLLKADMPPMGHDRKRQLIHSIVDNMHIATVSINNTAHADPQTKQKAATSALEAIDELMAAGEPEGFYWMGLCHHQGSLGVLEDEEKAVTYLSIAAEAGNADAARVLGDIYYKPKGGRQVRPDWTKAYEYYTRPGAAALGTEERFQAVDAMRAQRAGNRSVILYALMLDAIQLILLVLLSNTVWKDAAPLGVDILLLFISLMLTLLSAMLYRERPYNPMKYVLPAIAVSLAAEIIIPLFI